MKTEVRLMNSLFTASAQLEMLKNPQNPQSICSEYLPLTDVQVG